MWTAKDEKKLKALIEKKAANQQHLKMRDEAIKLLEAILKGLKNNDELVTDVMLDTITDHVPIDRLQMSTRPCGRKLTILTRYLPKP